MPWGFFTLALLLTFLVQTAVLPFFGGHYIDLLLMLALVCGLAAPTQEARLAGWITGFAQDVGTAGDSPVGLHAFALGLAVLAITHLRELVNQRLWWVRWLIGLIVAWPAQLLIQIHLRFLQGAHLSWSRMLWDSLLTALIAALLAGLVLELPAAFGRRRRRRRAAPRW